MKKNKVFDIILCVFLFIILQIVVGIGGILGTTAYNGVFMAFQFAVCLIIIRDDHHIGLIITEMLSGIALILLLRNLIVFHVKGTLPGLFNTLVYMVTLWMLARQFHIRELEAVTDVLTGLQNRRALYMILDERIRRKKEFHLLYAELGNLKMINDNHGQIYGDTLLRLTANMMTELVGNDGEVVRSVGDEFVIILDGSADPALFADKLIQKLSEKMELVVDENVVECYTSSYVGIASYPKDADNYDDLIKCADIAMHNAFVKSGHPVRFFDKELENKLKRNMELERLIKEGLKNDYFYLVYQPQYVLDGKVLRGFETLIRMKSPDGNVISPAEFIPIAEKGELAIEIDNYVLNRAMREFGDIVKNSNSNITLSINVSARNVAREDFVQKISRIVTATEFPPHNLEIEITEYSLLESVDVTIANIVKLHEMGIKVALDDFGTGYTSLSYLSKMPVNLLKIDKSLVDDIENNDKSKAFVSAVISMGHIMGCEVISEGVESESQVELLKTQKCDLVQGFVWGRPLDYEIAKKMVM